MNFVNMQNLIMQSEASDWISHDDYGTWVFVDDLLISIKREESEEVELCNEDWIRKYSNINTFKQKYLVMYAGNVVCVVDAVSVEYGSAIIPCPFMGGVKIGFFENKIGEIVNDNFEKYYEYLGKDGLNVFK